MKVNWVIKIINQEEMSSQHNQLFSLSLKFYLRFIKLKEIELSQSTPIDNILGVAFQLMHSCCNVWF